MIPVHFLSKIGLYEIQIHGFTYKVSLVDHPDLVETGIAELYSQLGTCSVVGLMAQGGSTMKMSMLQLCAGTSCLIIRFPITDSIPDRLRQFLCDPHICFVGVDTASGSSRLLGSLLGCRNFVELSELAARVLRKPSILEVCGGSGGLGALAAEVGVTLEGRSGEVDDVDWSARVFTDEQMKHVIADVCACCLIGKKLLGSLI